jgi:glycosyltransferase involved in cell wall biosynthesis
MLADSRESLNIFGYIVDMTVVSSSVIIPVIPKHLKYVSIALSDLSMQTALNDEVIVVASGFSPWGIRRLKKRVRPFLSLNVIVLKTALGPAGRNRNLGADCARGDLVMFLDVDDRFLPWRNERILDAFQAEKFDALVHLAEPSPQPESAYHANIGQFREDRPMGEIVSKADLFSATFPTGARNRDSELEDRKSVV